MGQGLFEHQLQDLAVNLSMQTTKYMIIRLLINIHFVINYESIIKEDIKYMQPKARLFLTFKDDQPNLKKLLYSDL